MARQIHLQIETDHCRACLPCLASSVCKVRAIVRIDPDEPPFLDIGRCYDCRMCISACPFGAIRVMENSQPLKVEGERR